MDVQSLFSASSPNALHVLSGSFNSLCLFLLAFCPVNRTVSLVQKIDAFGPHQYIATNSNKTRAYTTSWSIPPVLSSWEIERGETWSVNHLNNVNITAVSSYITTPPPHTHAYSAGGPSGEVHFIDETNGGFGTKIQEILFVPEDKLPEADKTRAALRYGSHAVEFSPTTRHAFIPVLGTDTVEMYDHDSTTGRLRHVFSSPSPRKTHDGPRHLKVHPHGKILYCVTEHNNYLDMYQILPSSLEYISSASLIPLDLEPSTNSFRGDTLILAPSTPSHPAPLALFATTRGAKPEHRGWLTVFELDADGLLTSVNERYETPTSGGKANAIDVRSKDIDTPEVWILLTDDTSTGPGLRVLEWDGIGRGGVREVASWPQPTEAELMSGGSHAVWL